LSSSTTPALPRQDEINTLFCVTVAFDSLADHAVTDAVRWLVIAAPNRVGASATPGHAVVVVWLVWVRLLELSWLSE
jgi:hypothetical protein